MYENNAASDLAKTGQRELKKASDRVTDQAQTLQSNLAEAGKSVVQNAEQYYDEARTMLTDVIGTSVDYVKKNPVRSIAGAAVLGYFIGLVSRRR